MYPLYPPTFPELQAGECSTDNPVYTEVYSWLPCAPTASYCYPHISSPETSWPPEYSMEENSSTSLQVEISQIYIRLGELIWLQQEGQKSQSIIPPPAPPSSIFTTTSVQTEITNGEIEALSDRILLYFNKCKLLESRLAHQAAENKYHSSKLLDDLIQVRAIVLQVSTDRNREGEEAEAIIADLRKENNRLKESLKLTESRLSEATKMIAYYTDAGSN